MAVIDGPFKGLEGTAMRLSARGSSDPDGDSHSYSWSFGDGSLGGGPEPQHTYANNGQYRVTLIVTDRREPTGAATLRASRAIL